MCTVTFIPNSNNGFTLTSSRDEIASRGITKFPVEKQLKNETIYFPQDPQAGGTWITTSQSGKVACLLNGGFTKHKHTPPYRMSRGKVVLDSFSYGSFAEFGNSYNLDGIEPFTMILIEQNKTNTNLYELIWDGSKKHFNKINSTTQHIWSSSTLYNNEIKKIREIWFKDWLIEKGPSATSLFDFHQIAGDLSDEFNIKMKRKNGPETVSITQVSISLKSITERHLNFISEEDNQIQLPLKSTPHA